jgi:dephospho-CoA kinase
MRIGIAGGLGSGKSTVGEMLKAKGARIFPADELGHNVLSYPHEAHFKTVALFGRVILDMGPGTGPIYAINRKKLAELVFNHDPALHALSRIVHPAVRQMFRDGAALIELGNPKTIVGLESAILFESGFENEFSAIIGVTCDREEQIARGMRRDNATREQIEKRIQRQFPFEAIRHRCTHVIDTNDWSTVPGQVDQIWSALTA